jgi:hypothetical protein
LHLLGAFAAGDVFSLDLSNNRLSGVLPEAWGTNSSATLFKRFNLNGNYMSGTIPNSWARLMVSTSSFDMSRMQLSGGLPGALWGGINVTQFAGCVWLVCTVTATGWHQADGHGTDTQAHAATAASCCAAVWQRASACKATPACAAACQFPCWTPGSSQAGRTQQACTPPVPPAAPWLSGQRRCLATLTGRVGARRDRVRGQWPKPRLLHAEKL